MMIEGRVQVEVEGWKHPAFLHDGRLVARLDLKADRGAGRLLVQAAYAEPSWDDDRDLPALVERLEELAEFLDVPELQIQPRGDLAPALSLAVG